MYAASRSYMRTDMYRILRPNGQWIVNSFQGDLETVEGAMKRAGQFARVMKEYGEFLIYEGNAVQPSAAMRHLPLTEDDDS